MLKYLEQPDKNNYQALIEQYKEKIAHLEYRVAYLERIAKISQTLNSTLDLNMLLRTITQVATELTNTEACSILLFDADTGELKFVPATASTVAEKLVGIPVPLDDSIAGWVFKKARPMLIRDVTADPRWNKQVDEMSEFQTRSILGVPLKIKKEVIGVLELLNKQDEIGFTQDDIQIATTLASQVAVAIENARLWRDRQQAYEELSELDRLKTDFVNLASHELRTPLAVILGYASFLRDELSGQASEQLNMVLSSALKLRNLIDDMTNLRHIKTHQVELDVEIFSMRELVQEVLAEFSTLMRAKSLRLKTAFPNDDDPVKIEADRQKMYLIIANLVSNAIKFTPENGAVLVGLLHKGQQIILRVADTGIGIDKERQSRIFEDFYQIEPSMTRRFEGLGIGLSIVKGMVEIHHGQITVESVPGKGSQFTVTLPISIDL